METIGQSQPFVPFMDSCSHPMSCMEHLTNAHLAANEIARTRTWAWPLRPAAKRKLSEVPTDSYERGRGRNSSEEQFCQRIRKMARLRKRPVRERRSTLRKQEKKCEQDKGSDT